MSQLMQLKDVAESTRLGPLSGEVSAGEILHLVGPNGAPGYRTHASQSVA